ncbi:MAG: chorismate mutase [Clostridia bacterium]|nr:chorismate mutase [Clostridia bacterium]
MDIKELRNKIDGIDKEIVRLYAERMAVSSQVADYKRENGLPVLDHKRERELLDKISDLAGDELERYARVLYESILATSRAYQDKKLGIATSLYSEISDSREQTGKLFPERASVACQGVEGAYSQIAAEGLFRLPSISYYNTFEDVFTALDEGKCKYAVLPVENSTAGSVNKVYDLMRTHKFYIVRSMRIRIEHNLFALPGTKLSDIREIVSHEQALSQSADYIASLQNVRATPVLNTAIAAETVKRSGRHDLGALSSRACGDIYGLECLASSVQDRGANYTRFICISKELEIYPGADRTSFMMVISQRPGSLYRILSKLNACGINMRKLESRPLPDKDFQIMFYLDADISAYSPELPTLLAELQGECEELRYLGTYSEEF